LFIDELDVKLHPLVVKYLLDLFNNPETNPNNAQLIFTTHNTYLLDKRFLRRDQIWFAQKDKYGSSEIYSLAEFEEVRKDASYSRDYLLGRYGAVPIV
jgi:AAA15 family ATPase/GTPase